VSELVGKVISRVRAIFSAKERLIYEATINLDIERPPRYQRGTISFRLCEDVQSRKEYITLVIDDKHEKVRLRILSERYQEFFGKIDDFKAKVDFNGRSKPNIDGTQK
jgi:hypothetical protein